MSFQPPLSPQLHSSCSSLASSWSWTNYQASGSRYISRDADALETLRSVADAYDVPLSPSTGSAVSADEPNYFSPLVSPRSTGTKAAGCFDSWRQPLASDCSPGHAAAHQSGSLRLGGPFAFLTRSHSDAASVSRSRHRRNATTISTLSSASSSSSSTSSLARTSSLSSDSRRMLFRPPSRTSHSRVGSVGQTDRVSVQGSFSEESTISSVFGDDVEDDEAEEEELERYKTGMECQTCPLIFPGLPQYWGRVEVDEDGKLVCSNGCREPGMPRIRRELSARR